MAKIKRLTAEQEALIPVWRDKYYAAGASTERADRTLLKSPAGLYLRVINRSPEQDGSFRQYILPVSDNCEPLPNPNDPNGRLGRPQALTALNAVASTFGMTGSEYAKITAES